MLLPGLATAQQGNPDADAFRDNAKSAAKNLIAVAEEFPADKYGYKPTPAQMSVGDIVVHRKMSRAAIMTLTTADWADHYTQYANYLRLNGLLPSTAKKPAI